MLEWILLFSIPGGMEWILIFLAVLLLFGGRKIPELMRGIGKGIREFNDARSKVKNELEDSMKEEEEAREEQNKELKENKETQK